jgi:putative redox protein
VPLFIAAKDGCINMVKITGEYQGDLHCVATHEPSANTLETDAPKDNQGRGEAFSPTDLTATSLGTCIVTTMAIVARKHGCELRGARFEVTKEMSTDNPRRIVRLAVQVWLPLAKSSLPALLVGLLERVGESCPVGQSLNPSIEKPFTLHWAGE